VERFGEITLIHAGRTKETHHVGNAPPSSRSRPGKPLTNDPPTPPEKRPVRSCLP
jgi:hypothetical protein